MEKLTISRAQQLPARLCEKDGVLFRLRLGIDARHRLRSRLPDQNPRTIVQKQLHSIEGVDGGDLASREALGRRGPACLQGGGLLGRNGEIEARREEGADLAPQVLRE